MSFYIIIRGPLGCGKTTVSKKLSDILRAKHFIIDKTLYQHNLGNEWEEGYISQKSFIKANELIAPQAKSLLEKGTPVIFDGNFYWKRQMNDLIKRLKFPHYIFTLKSSLDICIERDNERKKPHGKEATEAVYKK